jgi:hypothetical protein
MNCFSTFVRVNNFIGIVSCVNFAQFLNIAVEIALNFSQNKAVYLFEYVWLITFIIKCVYWRNYEK